jgi:MFS family permease
LYPAGFTTAFGAHAIAANLGGCTRGRHDSLLVLGVLLALYDGAEVLLKPVFGTLSDRAGPRPVLLAGLAAFAVFSAAFAVAVRAGNLVRGSDQQGCPPSHPDMMITGHVPSVRLPSHHAGDHVAAAVPA